ncbi:MAG: hypothetical protein U9Q30_08290, partial [Campylobacterota bacterium]|nr:hypothetical protein [Campylobacterota bacterium]
MGRFLFSISILSSTLIANDYGFNFDELEAIEIKSYEYNGYIKGDYKYQELDENYKNIYLGEFFLNYKYFKDNYTFHLDIMANYENIDNKEDDKTTLNQGFLNYKYDDNHQVYIGKKSPKWGKGYYINPIAFIDIKKDPNNPEASREGFTQLNYKYNKVLNSSIKNIAFDMVYIKTTKNNNEELYNENSNILAFKTYLLYKDIDIDLIYSYSDKDYNKIGFDFSTNIKTNFEIHGEYGRFDNGYYSYLLGLKYLTLDELTILSEYYSQNKTQEKNIPFWDKRYIINSFTQKEPFDILYFNLYYKNIYNIDDNSHQNKLGFIYSGIKNLELDTSISKNP